MFFKLSLAAALALCSASYGQIILPPNCARNYTVQLGDVCNSISAKEDVSTYQLAFVNPQIDPACDNLAEGEPLCLGITGQDCSSIHVVVSGDQCGTIASGAGIPLSTLLANNPNVNSACSNIGIGEVLCTASQIIHYTNSTNTSTITIA